MTDKFASAAELMRQVLGAHGYPFAVINHPISSATPAELTLQAQQAAAACVNILAPVAQHLELLPAVNAAPQSSVQPLKAQ